MRLQRAELLLARATKHSGYHTAGESTRNNEADLAMAKALRAPASAAGGGTFSEGPISAHNSLLWNLTGTVQATCSEPS